MAPMDAYRETIRSLPRPTDEQIRAFAQFVAGDHSWYKKLPMRGQGEPFFLYIHPAPRSVWIETGDGSGAWRDILRVPNEQSVFPRWAIDYRAGDVEPRLAPLNHIAGRMSSAEYRESLGHWAYWNHGPPDQCRVSALDHAAAHLRVRTPLGDLPVPEIALELGLVYLRATVSGYMGPMDEEYEHLRRTHDLPAVEDDCRTQIEDLCGATRRVAEWAFDI